MNSYKNLTSIYIYIILSALNLNADNTSLLHSPYRVQQAAEAFQDVRARIKDIHSGPEMIDLTNIDDKNSQTAFKSLSKPKTSPLKYTLRFKKLNDNWEQAKSSYDQSINQINNPRMTKFFDSNNNLLNFPNAFKTINYLIKDINEEKKKDQRHKEYVQLDGFLNKANTLASEFKNLLANMKEESKSSIWKSIKGLFVKKPSTLEQQLINLKNKIVKLRDSFHRELYIDKELQQLNTRLANAKKAYNQLIPKDPQKLNPLKQKLSTASILVSKITNKKNITLEGEVTAESGNGDKEAAPRPFDKVKNFIWTTRELFDDIEKIENNLLKKQNTAIKSKLSLDEPKEDINKEFEATEEFEQKLLVKEQFKQNVSALNNVLKEFRNSPLDIKDIKGDEKQKRGLVQEIKKDFASQNELLTINQKARELEYFQEKMLEKANMEEIIKQTSEAQDQLNKLLKIKKEMRKKIVEEETN